jgi:hypothetical protein
VKAGDTFRLLGVAERHTWVILSDPEIDGGRVLFVGFTGYYPGMDPSCIIEVEEFTLLDKRSCIYYEDIKEASVTTLEARPARGRKASEANARLPGVARPNPGGCIPFP